MNINISNPFFLHNEIVLHNSRLSIDSRMLSKLLNIPYPKLLKAIQLIIDQNSKRKNDFIMVTNVNHANRRSTVKPVYLITPHGIDQLAAGTLKKNFSYDARQKIQHRMKFRSYDQRIQG